MYLLQRGGPLSGLLWVRTEQSTEFHQPDLRGM
jgi:hypothetical protein